MRKLIFLFALISTFIFGQTPNGSRKAWTDTLRVSYNNQFIDILDLIRDSLTVVADTSELSTYPGSGFVSLKQLSSSNTLGGGILKYKSSGTARPGIRYSGIGSGVWERAELSSGEIHLDWFSPDTSDYATALNKAISVMVAEYGTSSTTKRPEIVIDGGYTVASPIYINHSGIKIVGRGPENRQVMLSVASDFNGDAVFIFGSNTEAAHSFEIDNIRIYGNYYDNIAGSVIHGMWLSDDSTAIPHDGVIRKCRVERMSGTAYFIEAGDDVYLEDCQAASNKQHGIFIDSTGAVSVIAGDYENSGHFNIYIRSAHANRFLWPKTERSDSGTDVFLEGASYNTINLYNADWSKNYIIDDKSYSNYFGSTYKAWGMFVNNAGVANNFINLNTSPQWLLNPFGLITDSLTSDIGSDMTMEAATSTSWSIVGGAGTSDYRVKRNWGTQGLREFPRSLLTSTDNAGKYIYQTITNPAGTEDTSYVFITTYATPQTATTDTLNVKLVEDPSGTPNTILDLNLRKQPFGVGQTTGKWEGWQHSPGFVQTVIDVDSTKDLQLRFENKNGTANPAISLIGKTYLKENELQNGSFDYWDTVADDTMRHWFRYKAAGTLSRTDGFTGYGLTVTADTVWLQQTLNLTVGKTYIIGAKYKLNSQAYVDSLKNYFSSSSSSSETIEGFPFYMAIGATSMTNPVEWNDSTPHWRHSQLVEKGSYSHIFRGWVNPVAGEWCTMLGVVNLAESQTQNLYLAMTPWSTFKANYSITIDDVFIIPLD